MSRRQRETTGHEEPKFEDALAELEALVENLETGELSLEDSLVAFENGVRLVRFCSDRLRAAELRVSELQEAADGPMEVPLREDDET